MTSSNTHLATLVQELESRKNETHGTFGSITISYDDIYSTKFRSATSKLSDFCLVDNINQEEKEELIGELVNNFSEYLYFLESGTNINDLKYEYGDDDDDNEYSEYDGEYYRMKNFIDELEDENGFTIRSLINDNTLICSLCNYKGEGEGVALFESVQKLNIFVSKYNYS